MPYEALHNEVFLDRVKRGANYFAKQLQETIGRPIDLSKTVETGNKQAAKRLSNTLSDLQQAYLSRRYLLTRISEQGFTVANYLKQKQLATIFVLDATDSKSKPKRKRKTKTKS